MEDETLQQFQMMTPMNVLFSDGARCLKVGGGMNAKNRTYQRPFTSTVCVSLVGNLGPLPSPVKKLNKGLAEMQFPAALMALLALFSLFLVDILTLPLP